MLPADMIYSFSVVIRIDIPIPALKSLLFFLQKPAGTPALISLCLDPDYN